MENTVAASLSLAVISGVMNGLFTLPMRFLGRWNWEHVWSLFILVSCLVMPSLFVFAIIPHAWTILNQAPPEACAIAVLSGFFWGFGSIMFGQTVSAIGISLANTLVLAISSSLGSILPLLVLAPGEILERRGATILAGVAIAVVGIAFCGAAGWKRECAAGKTGRSDRGDMVGRARSLRVGLLLAGGAGVLSAVFNIGFTLAQPIAAYARQAGLSQFESTNLIWWIMLVSASASNLGFCLYLLLKNRSVAKFRQAGRWRLYFLTLLMGLLWGGSIFVYGAAVPRLGTLGTSIGWPLSLAVGLLTANAAGLGMGEWRHAPGASRRWLYGGIAVLFIAVVVLGSSGS